MVDSKWYVSAPLPLGRRAHDAARVGRDHRLERALLSLRRRLRLRRRQPRKALCLAPSLCLQVGADPLLSSTQALILWETLSGFSHV